MKRYRLHILVCGGTGCRSAMGAEIVDMFNEKLKALDMLEEVQVVTTGCFGFCEQGPIVKTVPDNIFYVRVKPEDIDEIIAEHILKGRPVERLIYDEKDESFDEKSGEDIPFYRSQKRIALRNCGIIDPENIEDYISVDGYEALGRVLTGMKPEEVVAEVVQSGLRGRGGGGFPTGKKWEIAAKNKGERKYVICNADEGDPGAFMDRSILEGDPHSVLEAMAICGYAIGANDGVVYIRAEYPLAVNRLKNAIEQAEAYGMLGEDIFGSGFDFKIHLNLGAGAFVCGEETSLMNSVQGERGEPRVKPPFPAESGLWESPTNINNVETFANICPIILNGAQWFSSIGTEKSKGTKVFALAGKVNNVGLVEVPMGTPLKEIIFNIGGGIRNDKKFKAVQTGGPSGGCIPSSMLDLQIDYDNLKSIGSMMGSGGMIVMDEDDCMVNIAKFYLEFTMDESCGKCTPCRIGNTRLHEILNRITEGKGEESDLAELDSLGNIIKDCSLCGLGQTAPNPVLSTLKYFHDEYEEHIKNKKCPAKACKSLLEYRILPDKCIGCTVCARNCPVTCISGERKAVHEIDQDRCVKCGLCMQKCPVDAIVLE